MNKQLTMTWIKAIGLLTFTSLLWAFVGYGLACVAIAMIFNPLSPMGILSWVLVASGLVGWSHEIWPWVRGLVSRWRR